jgi:sigma-E factor negative regulatory protein RseC
MPKNNKTVDHLGRVNEVTQNDIMVSILSHSACSTCSAKGGCGMSESVEKTVVVHKQNHTFLVGQSVKVLLKQTLGFKALFLGYVIPFIIVLFGLILLTAFKVSEGKAGLISLSLLMPYYLVLYNLRDRLSKQFTFEIESI